MGISETWSTNNELQFIRRLKPNDRLKYKKIVLGGYRRWDRSLDVERIKKELRKK